jgi:M6 family metalloprotease-like protein
MRRVFRQASLAGLAIAVCAGAVFAQNSGEAFVKQLPGTQAASPKLFEKNVELSGELEVIIEDYKNSAKVERFLKTPEGRIPLQFKDSPDAKSGARISLTGVSLDGKVAVESYSTSQPEALANATGEKRVLLILVNFQDKQTQPYTLEQARDVAFNTTSNFLRENSYGQTWLTGDVYGWYTIPVSSTSCDVNTIGSYARQAVANAGVNVYLYTNIVYAFPANACGFSGTATVGGAPAQAWIRGDRFGLEAFGHELGHNYGLEHSRSLDCGTEVVNGTCTMNEYGDQFDLMGPGAPYHYNAYQKERLGWLNSGSSPVLQTVNANGTYYLDAYETGGTGIKGLKILRSIDPVTGARTWYYIEHRTATGFDSSLSAFNLQNGVVFHTGTDGDGTDNYLLDMTPLTASWYDSFLSQGQTYSDANIGLIVTVLSADNTGANVQIQVSTQACIRSNPTVSVTPGQSNWMFPGAAATYQIYIKNNNAGGCSSETFNITSKLPSGMSASYGNSSIDLANGASTTAAVSVSSAPTANDGVYSFKFNVTNLNSPANTASGATSYILISRLDMTAAPGALSYSRTQTATVSAQVFAGGAPLAGVPVTFTLTAPGGKVKSQTVTAGADGRAVFSYKFDKRRDPIGTYSVVASASMNGRSGQATTSFVASK